MPAPACSFLPAHACCCCLLLPAHACSCLPMPAPTCSCLLMHAHACPFLLMPVHACIPANVAALLSHVASGKAHFYSINYSSDAAPPIHLPLLMLCCLCTFCPMHMFVAYTSTSTSAGEAEVAGVSTKTWQDWVVGTKMVIAVYAHGLLCTLAPLAQWLERWSYEP